MRTHSVRTNFMISYQVSVPVPHISASIWKHANIKQTQSVVIEIVQGVLLELTFFFFKMYLTDVLPMWYQCGFNLVLFIGDGTFSYYLIQMLYQGGTDLVWFEFLFKGCLQNRFSFYIRNLSPLFFQNYCFL